MCLCKFGQNPPIGSGDRVQTMSNAGADSDRIRTKSSVPPPLWLGGGDKNNQRTTGPVSFTWVLRICWIRTNLQIQEHSMLYKLSPIRKHQEQIWHPHKNGQGQPRVIIWKKPQGMGIQPLGSSSGSILKHLLFPSFCTSSRNIPFAHYFMWYFVLFHTCI